MFANYFSQNQVRQPHMHRTGFSGYTLALGGLQVGNQELHQRELPSDRVGLSHTIISGNQFSFTNCGINIRQTAHKTFVLETLFQEVDTPIMDEGVDTFIHDNRLIEFDAQGFRMAPFTRVIRHETLAEEEKG